MTDETVGCEVHEETDNHPATHCIVLSDSNSLDALLFTCIAGIGEVVQANPTEHWEVYPA
jgi:hypothetical protein